MIDAIARWLASVLAALGWFFTGTLKQRAKELEREIGRVEAANRAAAGNRARPVDERLRDARERGLYRLPGTSPDDKRG